LNLTNNYIDISDDKEQISFITDRKAQEILNSEKEKYVYYTRSGRGILRQTESNKSIFELLEYEPIGDRAYIPNNSERGEILKIVVSPTSGSTYLKIKFPGGTTVINQNSIRYEDFLRLPFSRNRQQIRVGRGIRGILRSASLNFNDSEIEKFVNLYKSECDKLNDIFRNFELVSGTKIPELYNWRNYEMERSKGTLSQSCMCSAPSHWFNIYSDNPDKVSMLVLKSEKSNKIKGRAIVWNLDSPKITYMDRIYTHDDSDVNLFKEYAKKMGWFSKPENNYISSSNVINPNGELEKHDNLIVKLKPDEEYFPYLDTLKYYNQDTGELSVDPLPGISLILNDTEGRYEGFDSYECDYCYGTGRIECGNCDGAGEMNCDVCDGSGKVDDQNCTNCDGDGSTTCSRCGGDGRVDCMDC